MKVRKEFHAYLLFPLALFYWGLIYWRNLFYKYGFFVSRRLPCIVISVGNITVGGTGKTPMVIFLASYLQTIGKKVAILSRGYGRTTSGTVLISDGQDLKVTWEEAGDEPYLMANKLKQAPIVVDEDRHRGGLFLMQQFNPEVILLDDGFQHRALVRDLDLVLVNSGDTIFDHKLMPYGILREPWLNCKRGDALILTKTNLKKSRPFLKRKIQESGLPSFKSTTHVSISSLSPEKPRSINGKTLCIVSAIGDAHGFRKSVEQLGCKIDNEIIYPDHYSYSQTDWNEIESHAKNIDYIVTTEKDWVKLESYYNKNFPVIVLGVDIQIKSNTRFNSLLNKLFQ